MKEALMHTQELSTCKNSQSSLQSWWTGMTGHLLTTTYRVCQFLLMRPLCKASLTDCRSSLWQICLFNQCSISKIGIESFFSELTSIEFSGLGCPKAVDILQLISHVTELNAIHHDTDHGFVFNTTNRGAYPYHTLQPPADRNQTRFNLPWICKQRKAQSLLALPKAITHGQVTIHEFHCKDESKVPLHRRAGVPETFDAIDPSNKKNY